MKKETIIFILIIVISVAVLTALDIQTKGKITSLIGSVNPMDLKSSDVPYTNNSQSTVQGAIDDLYTKATQKVTLDGVENVGFQTNTAKTIFANSNGLCLTRKGKTSCFKINNWNVEKNHIQQVFSDARCYVASSDVNCYASDFYCAVTSPGDVVCSDYSDSSSCFVNSGGSVNCD